MSSAGSTGRSSAASWPSRTAIGRSRAAAKPRSPALPALVAKAAARSRRHPRLERDELGAVNYRHRAGAARARGASSSRREASRHRHHRRQSGDRAAGGGAEGASTRGWSSSWRGGRARRRASRVTLRAADGAEKELPTLDIYPRLPGQPAVHAAAGAGLREPGLGVPVRRSARVEHRRRHLPGDLRHRDDGHAS